MPLDFHREANTMACIALEERQCLPTVALLKTGLVQSAAPLPPLSLLRTVPPPLNSSAARPFGSLSATVRPVHTLSMDNSQPIILVVSSPATQNLPFRTCPVRLGSMPQTIST